MGAQVVRINADLLHFHSTPLASESSIGGVDLIGAKVDAQASAKNAAMSKGRFIAVLPISGACRLALFLFEPLFDRGALISGVGFSLSSREGENGFVEWAKSFHGNLADETSSQDRDRQLGLLTGEFWTPLRRDRTGGARSLRRIICHGHCHRTYEFQAKLDGTECRLGSRCRGAFSPERTSP